MVGDFGGNGGNLYRSRTTANPNPGYPSTNVGGTTEQLPSNRHSACHFRCTLPVGRTDRPSEKRLPCSERSLLHEPCIHTCGTDDHRCLLPSWPCSRSCFWASLPAFNARQPSQPFYWTQVWVACRSWPDDVRLLLAGSSATAHVSNP